MRPAYIVIDTQSNLKAFKYELNRPEMPCIDLDAVLERVVDSLSSRVEAPQEIANLHRSLSEDELLGSRSGIGLFDNEGDYCFYETIEENVFGFETIVDMAKKIGHNLNQQIEAYKLYKGDELGYEYHGIVDEHAIVLRARTRR